MEEGAYASAARKLGLYPNFPCGLPMRPRTIAAIAIAVIVGGGVAYAISPYFTESEINESLPEVIMQSDMGEMLPGVEDVPMSRYSGPFVGVGDGVHDARGTARVLELAGDGSEILRLEDFYATNGPALHVYLSVDDEATDYIDLGDLKANRGNQNYSIPEGTDISTYNKVLIWCEPFSVLFGSASLS